MWPLQIFKTLHWRNVCLARSVTLSCKFVVFCPGFNALIQTAKVSSRSGTRHNSKNSLYGSRWQMAALPKSSKNNLEASFGWTATVQELSTCQWHHGLQQIKGGAAGQTFHHACTACTVFDTSTSKYQKKKIPHRPQGSLLKTAGDKKLRKLLLSCPAHRDRRDPSSPSQLQPAELLPGNIYQGQITGKNNKITLYFSMLNLIYRKSLLSLLRLEQ